MGTSRNLHYFLLIVGGLLVVRVETYPRIPDSPQELEITDFSTGRHFEILKLTQQWPQTICFTFQEKGASELCKSLNDSRWTIHGLWPTQLHTKKPAYCDNSARFNATAIASIEKELNATWPTLAKNKPSQAFWEHEWEKHGTCSTMLQPVNTQEKYFKKTMQLRDKFYVKNLLEKVNILPGQSYPVQNIADQVSRVLGKRCVISYVCHPTKHESYLAEIQICFDKSFKLTDCDGNIDYPEKCSHTRDVIYPESSPIF
ncbi:ribonuclease T2 [Diachasma alloeum]|uniref:ribonuclease T2 n=1 Tax=Diachasma alloeum TaxID=454923 RepID=UPI0007383CDB|nr:ribonuclease T2 [Diachasma alloeum]